jgi:hypothetical protein
MTEVKKVKAVKATILPTTAVEQIAKKVPVKKVKPEKLKFNDITATLRIPAKRVQRFFESVVDLVISDLIDDHGGDWADYEFIKTSTDLLAALVKELSKAVDLTDHYEPYEIFDITYELGYEKIFADQIKVIKAAGLAKEKEEAERVAAMKQKAANDAKIADELAKSVSSIYMKKSDLAKAAELLKQAGITIIS